MTTLVRAVDSKVPLDQVFFCGLVTGFFLRLFGPGNPWIPNSRMIERISFLLTTISRSRMSAARIHSIP
jgi:hypothetical protein